MDTSETYKKMCEKAEEIQEQKSVFEVGDWVSKKQDRRFREAYSPAFMVVQEATMIDYDNPGLDDIPPRGKHDIWLPCQDQLQEMFSKDWRKVVSFLMASAKNLDCSKVETMEQLCLVAIMRDKFQKLWNGEDWILSPIWTVVVTRLEDKHEVE